MNTQKKSQREMTEYQIQKETVFTRYHSDSKIEKKGGFIEGNFFGWFTLEDYDSHSTQHFEGSLLLSSDSRT